MSAGAALEAHLRTHSDDHESWLVYADWLSDSGDVRGKLITLEHRRSHATSREERGAIEREIEALVEVHRPRWLGRAGGSDAIEEISWLHGFVSRARLRGAGAVRVLERLIKPQVGTFLVDLDIARLPLASLAPLLALLRASHVRKLRLQGPPSLGPGAGQIFAEARDLGPLRSLDLSRARLEDEGTIALVSSSAVRALVALDLGVDRIGPAGAAAIAAGPFASLRALSLSNNPLGPKGAASLSSSKVLRALSSLDIGACDLGDDGATALSMGLYPELSSLVLSGNRIGPAGIRSLLSTGALSHLTSLDLSDNPVGDEGAMLLAASAYLEGLESLDLSRAEIGPAGARALAEGRPRGLRALSLSGNPLGPRGALALAAGASLGRLAELGLAATQIGAGVSALGAASALPSLRVLHLGDNDLEPSHAAALVRGGGLRALVSLDLSGNKLGDDGMSSLSAGLPSVVLLDLSSNWIGPRGAQILAAAKGLGSLVSLVLDKNLIGDIGAIAIAESESLGALVRMSVRDNRIYDEGAEALASSQRLRSLARLDLSGNPIGKLGISARAPLGRQIIEG